MKTLETNKTKLLQIIERLNLKKDSLDFEENDDSCKVSSYDFNFALVITNDVVMVQWFDYNQNEREAKLTKSFEKKILNGWYQ